ncbi:hypothetical protein PMI40_00782 [Herbaspirillum sp. YR522]|nr:hypothetical protein PMI40_00782 [Herbaspirillum sp. YR522]
MLLHQAIVASSTIFLTAIIASFQAGKPFLPALVMFLATMTLPYLPGAISFYTLQVWVNRAHMRFVMEAASAGAGNVNAYRNGDLRERTESILARNSYPVIRDYLGAVHELASFALNSLLSVLVIGLLLPAQLLLGYLASLLMCAVIIAALTRPIARQSAHSEDCYVRFSATLSKCWDNLMLGNRHNRNVWVAQVDDDGQRFYRASNRLELIKQVGNVVLAAASLGPSVLLIVMLASSGQTAAASLAAVIVSLTRIFLILNALSTLVYRVLDLISLHAKMRVLFRLQASLSAAEDPPRGAISSISINGQAVGDMQQALDILASRSAGRFTITGPNGGGKSTVLLRLKEQHRDRGFLLPAQHGNLMWKSCPDSFSTGQRSAAILTEVLGIAHIKCLLLDEWDANMDEANTRRIDALLEHTSKERIVIETRH